MKDNSVKNYRIVIRFVYNLQSLQCSQNLFSQSQATVEQQCRRRMDPLNAINRPLSIENVFNFIDMNKAEM